MTQETVQIVAGVLAVLIIGIIIMRRKAPNAERPYRAFGYPITPLIYIVMATLLVVDLAYLAPKTSGIGYLLVLTGIPVFFLWRKNARKSLELSS